LPEPPLKLPRCPIRLRRVACHQDASHCRQRRAHNVHSPNQFVGSSIGVHSPHHHRQHLEGLWRGTLRQRESALDVLEVQSVGLTLFLHFVQKFLPQLGVLHCLGRAYDQVSLPSHRHKACLRAAVPV